MKWNGCDAWGACGPFPMVKKRRAGWGEAVTKWLLEICDTDYF